MASAAWEVLAEPRRRRLVRLCSQRPRGVNELHREMPDVTLGAISQHLARLRNAGILTVEQTGRNRFYRVEYAPLRELRDELNQMWATGLDRLSTLAQAKARERDR
jgi:DNA-binding transcriptional ArsR family regulator